ncbi:MAG: SsrA-binding protein SmpB [Kiritimatiellia bacterium]
MVAQAASIATNRKAFHDFEVLERFEAGVALQGTEVKSLRAGHVTLAGNHVRIERGEAILYGVKIEPYTFGNRFNHDPDRPRRLLLHRREIGHLQAASERQGNALIGLKLYFHRQKVKVEIGICRGRKVADKREVLKRKTADREAQRAVASARKR